MCSSEEGKERAPYYLGRMLVGPKLHYSPIEKMCLALMFAMPRLRHYIQVHTVRLTQLSISYQGLF